MFKSINPQLIINFGLLDTHYNLLRQSENPLKLFCIPERLYHISHQLFNYKIAFVNLHRKNTNSKGNFVQENRFKTLVLKIFGIQNIYSLK